MKTTHTSLTDSLVVCEVDVLVERLRLLETTIHLYIQLKGLFS
jgi:hypothetical protein